MRKSLSQRKPRSRYRLFPSGHGQSGARAKPGRPSRVSSGRGFAVMLEATRRPQGQGVWAEVSAASLQARRSRRRSLLPGLIRGAAGAVRLPGQQNPSGGHERLGCVSFTGLPPSLKRSRSVPPCAARRPSPEAPRSGWPGWATHRATPPAGFPPVATGRRFPCQGPGERPLPARRGGPLWMMGWMEWSEISLMARPKGPFLYRLVAVAESFAMDLHRRFFP